MKTSEWHFHLVFLGPISLTLHSLLRYLHQQHISDDV